MLLLTREEERAIEERNEGRKEMLAKVMELMKSNGISNEQIENIRNAAMNS